MSTIDSGILQQRLTPTRLSSYLNDSGGDVDQALALYDWNTALSGALHETLGRFEVVLRNALDEQLTNLASRRDWTRPWYRQPGLLDLRGAADVEVARAKAIDRSPIELHGKVVAELTFGFWRYLLEKRYHTTLWVPALRHAFPNHPRYPAADFGPDIRKRVQRLHLLRNRVAHHEPIHRRNIARDDAGLSDVVAWICRDSAEWITNTSRVKEVLGNRP